MFFTLFIYNKSNKNLVDTFIAKGNTINDAISQLLSTSKFAVSNLKSFWQKNNKVVVSCLINNIESYVVIQ